MQAEPKCPLCGVRKWRILGERRYLRSDLPKLSDYVQRRYRVLFDRWAKGEEAIECKSGMCAGCGFVSNIPRPTERDIEAKYRFLAELGQDYGREVSAAVQEGRARELYSFLLPRMPKAARRILDFGGGDGCLMKVFAEAGHQCMLVDYNASPQPYVSKVGDTIEQVDADIDADVIVCSHVIEHVAAPVSTLGALAKRLKQPGVLFVEVPMEIWRRPPLRDEPVTHVNFFVPASLRRCVAEVGLRIAYCRTVASLHPTGRKKPAIRLVADNVPGPSASGAEGPAEVARLLNPGWADRFRYARVARPNVRRALRKRLRIR